MFVNRNINFHQHPQPPYECAEFVLFDRQSNCEDGVLGISTIRKSKADNFRAELPRWFVLLETTILLADTSQIAMSRTPFELFIYLFSAFLWLLNLFVFISFYPFAGRFCWFGCYRGYIDGESVGVGRGQ